MFLFANGIAGRLGIEPIIYRKYALCILRLELTSRKPVKSVKLIATPQKNGALFASIEAVYSDSLYYRMQQMDCTF